MGFSRKSGRWEKSTFHAQTHFTNGKQARRPILEPIFVVEIQEFKEEAVRLAQQNGNTSETARNLGLQLSILRRWKKELEDHGEKAFPGKGHTHDEELRQLQRENQRLKETVEILEPMLHSQQVQKSGGYLHKPLLERYPFIEEHRNACPLERLCKAMGVSVSGYHAWGQPESDYKQENQSIVAQIKVIHRQSWETGPQIKPLV